MKSSPVGFSIAILAWLLSSFCAAQELQPRFDYYGDEPGIYYNTLFEAERAMHTDPDLNGAAYFVYDYTDFNDILRHYEVPPTPNYIEGGGISYAFGCYDCPIYNQFGQDICGGNTNNNYCASYTAWKSNLEQAFSSWPCPDGFTITHESPWSFLSVNAYTGLPYVESADTLPLLARYQRTVTYTLDQPGSGCTTVRTQSVSVTESRDSRCPAGRDKYSTGALGCYNEAAPIINVSLAKLPEPSANCPKGNPCHPASGQKSARETDFRSDTLAVERNYTSQQIYPDQGGLGRGWTHNYSQRLISLTGERYRLNAGIDTERFHCTDSPACTIYRAENTPGRTLKTVPGGWWLQTTDGERREFDDQGRLSRIVRTQPRYVDLSVLYDAEDRVETVIDQQGRYLQFAYYSDGDSDGLVSTITLPDGDLLQYTYQRAANAPAGVADVHNLVQVTYPNLSTRQYHYEDADTLGNPRFEHLLTGITDEKGIRYATYEYDAYARVIRSENAGGARRVTLNYTRRPGESHNWSITEVTTPNGEIQTFDMKNWPFRQVDSIEDSRGMLDYGYDSTTRWQTARTDRDGTQTLYEYADGLHLTRRTEAAGTPEQRIIETDWDTTHNRISERREPGRTTTYSYNTRGQVLTRTVTDPASGITRRWTYTYHDSPTALVGRLKTIDGPRTDVSDITTYDYYTSDDPGGDYLAGDLKSITNALGHTTDYLAYDGEGRLLHSRDANGIDTLLTYHPRGWLQSRTMAGKTTAFQYDAAGNMTRVTQPDSSVTTYTYDDAHRLIGLSDHLGNRIDYSLDTAGNRIAEQTRDPADVLHRQLSRVHDQLGRLQQIIDGGSDVTDFDYDPDGNRTRLTDANNEITQFTYDPLDRLIRTLDPLLGETDLAYDARDNLIAVTDPLDHTTSYVYDGLNNQLEIISPDAGTTRYQYDAAGNRIQQTDARGITSTYAYDAVNRLTGIQYPDTSLNISFQYDQGANGIGRLTGLSDAAGSSSYTYDARGNLTRETRITTGIPYVTDYRYNPADRLTGITYPSGWVVDYALDAAGRITGISADGQPLINQVQYQPFGPADTWTYGNGLIAHRQYDLEGQLVSQTLAGDNRALTYDPVGNIIAIDDPNIDYHYLYDALNRLIQADETVIIPPSSSPAFTQPPGLLAQIQTTANETAAIPGEPSVPWLTSVIANTTTAQTQLALERSEVDIGLISQPETQAWLAFSAGGQDSFTDSDGIAVEFETLATPRLVRGWDNGCYPLPIVNAYAEPPLLLATKNGRYGGDGGWLRRCSGNTASLTLDEDTHLDNERRHTDEPVGAILFSEPFRTDLGSGKMEAGEILINATTIGSPFTAVSFKQTYSEPPLVFTLVSDQGSDPVAARIRNVTTSGFEVTIAEPPGKDGPHASMTITYLAISPGQHQLGNIPLEAGSAEHTKTQAKTGGTGWQNIIFSDIINPGGPQTDSRYYDYDANGNRLSLIEAGISYPYTTDSNSNRLLATEGPQAKTYTHDAAGNIIDDGTHSYNYDDRDRLTAIDGTIAIYDYDGRGQRIAKITPIEERYFVYGQGGELLGEYDELGNPIAEYMYFQGQPVAMKQGSEVLFIHADHLGTPRAVTAAGQTVVWQWQSDPFGGTLPDQDPDADGVHFELNLRFPGQYFDQETGLHYNYFRDYDPATGRYVQSDPIGLRGGLNIFAYALSNPNKYIDPQGLTSLFPGPDACEYYDQACSDSCDSDEYACNAKKCCESFGDNFFSNCTRKCLIDWDIQRCAGLAGEARNSCRRRAHYWCYLACFNVRDGFGTGIGFLPPLECRRASDAIGGMW